MPSCAIPRRHGRHDVEQLTCLRFVGLSEDAGHRLQQGPARPKSSNAARVSATCLRIRPIAPSTIDLALKPRESTDMEMRRPISKDHSYLPYVWVVLLFLCSRL